MAGPTELNEEPLRSADQIEAAIAERLTHTVPAGEDQAGRLGEAFPAPTPDRQGLETRVVALEKKLEQNRLVLQQKEREFGRDVAMLKSALAAAHAARASAVARAEKQELEAIELRLQTATAQERLQALVAEHEGDRERIAADHRAAVDTLQQSLARAGEDAALHVEQSHQALAELRAQVAQTSAEQARLVARVEAAEAELALQHAEHERAHDRLAAEHQQALADVQTGKRDELEALERRLQAATAAQERLQALVAEHEGDRERIAADHRAALDTLQQSLAGAREDAALDVGQWRQALAESRVELAQALAEQTRIAARVEDQAREQDRIRAEHHRALADMESGKRDAMAELRSQHEQERDRISAAHALAIADLRVSRDAAAAGLRSQLSDAVADQHRLTALLEEHDRERERVAAEHRRAIADVQASKQETVAECERVLTEVQQALLARDPSRRLEVERRLIDGIGEGPQVKGDGQRLAALQSGLTQAFSQMQAVLKDGPALTPPLEAEHERAEDADLLHEPFDDADESFVHQLLGGIPAKRVPETRADPKTGGPAQAVSGMPAPKTDDLPADDMFDATDATFARRLMDTPGPKPSPS